MTLSLRLARPDDTPVIETLIQQSCRELGSDDYTLAQIEGALKSAWGVDRQLIADKTYYVVEHRDGIVGCGGWSFRETLFGASHALNRDAGEIDPATGSARIRAFFVQPQWARQGIASLILEHCEQQAKNKGFSRFSLMATLPGQRLYQKFGYRPDAPVDYPLNNDLSIRFVPMRKLLNDTAIDDHQFAADRRRC